jgi:hypothetical protein
MALIHIPLPGKTSHRHPGKGNGVVVSARVLHLAESAEDLGIK